MTSMAVSSAWYYKLQSHKAVYGSAIVVLGILFMGLAGHDIDILRGIAEGYYDANAAHDVYLENVSPSYLSLVWLAAVVSIFVGISYIALVSIAHRKMARDGLGPTS